DARDLVGSSDADVAAFTHALDVVSDPRAQAATTEADLCASYAATETDRKVTRLQASLEVKSLQSQIDTLLAALLQRAFRLNDMDTRNKQLLDAAKKRLEQARQVGDSGAADQIGAIVKSAQARQDAIDKETAALNNIKQGANDSKQASDTSFTA